MVAGRVAFFRLRDKLWKKRRVPTAVMFADYLIFFLLPLIRLTTCEMDRRKRSWTCRNQTRHSFGMDYLRVRRLFLEHMRGDTSISRYARPSNAKLCAV
jgi:hypothetical protein